MTSCEICGEFARTHLYTHLYMLQKRKRGACCKSGGKKYKHSCNPTMYPVGTYVSWRFPGDDATYKEGRVVQDNGDIIQVVRYNKTLLNISKDLRNCVHATNWRASVTLNDTVYYCWSDTWIPCRVHAKQGDFHSKKTPEVLVLEPVFYGATISVPTLSLRLRHVNALHPSLKALLETGFAFENALACSRKWAKYRKHGNVASRRMKQFKLARMRGTTQTFCFVLPPPCVLPDGIVMVRTMHGELQFVEACMLSHTFPADENEMNKKILGTLKFSLSSTTQPFKSSDGLLIPCLNACHLARDFYNHGDPTEAAKLMRDSTEDFADANLVDALLVLSGNGSRDKSYPVHPVGRLIWQHSMMHRKNYVQNDLQSLHETLDEIVLFTTRRETSRMKALETLRNRVAIWAHYPIIWSVSRRLQIESESYQPVSVCLKKLTKSQIHFKVSATTPYFPHTSHITQYALHVTAPVSSLSHMSNILSQFTPDFDVADSNICAQKLFDKSKWAEEVIRICSRRTDTLADSIFQRETMAQVPLRKILNCEAVAADGSKLLWNPLQGPLHPEHDAANVFPECAAGGIVVVPCNYKRMTIMADLMKKMYHGEKVSSLVITVPTTLYLWQQVLQSRGISCYVYHGNRRQANVVGAMEQHQVIITTTHTLTKWMDLSFFVNASTHQDRLIFDVGTVLEHPKPAVLDGISRLKPKYMWMLSTQPTIDSMAIALPLLNVQPFSRQSGWGTDLVSDYRRRDFVRHFLYNESYEAENVTMRKALHGLVGRIFFVADMRAQSEIILRDVLYVKHKGTKMNNECRSPFQENILRLFKKKLWKVFDIGSSLRFFPSKNKLMKSWQFLTNICWGMRVSPRCYGNYISCGNYSVDPDNFMIMQIKDTSTCSSTLQKAKDALDKLNKYESVDGDCPICMEPLCKTGDNLPPRDDLSSMVVVSDCGHMFCAECVDQIFRVARENVASGSNDYGMGDNSVNHPRCPLCREYWDITSDPPLIMPTQRNVVLHGGDPLYEMSTKCSDGSTYAKARKTFLCPDKTYFDTPLIRNLHNVLAGIHRDSTFKKVVILCRAPGLAQHLKKMSNLKKKQACAVTVHSRITVKSRGNAIKAFMDPSSSITEMYLSATMTKGLAFPGVRHFVFADRVHSDDVSDIVHFINSCCHGMIESHSGFLPVIHTMGNVSCAQFKSPQNQELASVLCAASASVPVTNLACAVPVLPLNELDYIEKLHNIFETPISSELVEKYLLESVEDSQTVCQDEEGEGNHRELAAEELGGGSRDNPESGVERDEEQIFQYLSQADLQEIFESGLPLAISALRGQVIRV